ncbi:MAG: pyridoxal phosphate-dependent aminotransferase [Chitinophagales bacterium]
MPSISNKGKNMPASPIRKLVPYAEAAKKRGVHIYHLNIGQPDIETPKQMMDAVRNIDFKTLEYSHSAGFESYRKKLLAYYNIIGVDLNLEDLIVTTGGSEAILFALMSCFDEGDEIIIPEPFYANYNAFATAAGVKINPIVSSISNGFALPPISAFESIIGEKTKGIIICNPNNPTGYLYSKDELMALRELVLKHDLFLFADEVYREFIYGDESHFSVLELDDVEQNVVVVDSISKRYSACGARIGALISRNKNVMQTALKFAQARLSPPTFAQIAAEAATDVPQSYFESVNKEYIARRDLLAERLNKIDGVICPIPKGAFYAMVKLPVSNTEDFCKWMLESYSYEGATVMMAPGSGFYSTPGMGMNEVRIAYVLNKADLNKALDCLEKGLEQYCAEVEQDTQYYNQA